MTVEFAQLLPDFTDDIDLLEQDLIQILGILLNIGPWLIYFIKQVHLIFDHTDNLINVSPMRMYQLLLLLKDLLYQLLMVIAQIVCILSILVLQFLHTLHFVVDVRQCYLIAGRDLCCCLLLRLLVNLSGQI